MDYEKLYKEALERARTGKPMNEVFPELHESEDEKTRKHIIEILNRLAPCHWDGNEKARCIAYLEKQKEQKPVKCIDFDNEFENQVSHLIASVLNGEHEYSEGFVKYAVQSLLGYAKSEMNPVEWSEEDEKQLNDIISLLPDLTIRHAWLLDIKRRLKSLCSQPKREKQIKKGDKVKIHCRKDRKKDMVTTYDGKVGEVIYVWDAQRNPWGHIGVRLDNGCNNGFHEDELEILDEPHWKPSEEQMNALYKVAYNFIGIGTETDVYLVQLYEQLEKL